MDFELPKSQEQKATQGLLEQLKEVTVENSKKVLDWFKEFFTQSKEKGLKATLMGPFIGFLTLMNSIGKLTSGPQDESRATDESPHAPEIRDQLDNLRSALPSALDHTTLESEEYEISKTDPKITLCSGTALKNLRKMGCAHYFSAKAALKTIDTNPEATFSGVPAGDAIDVMNFYKQSRHHSKIAGTPFNRDLPARLDASGKNLADVLVDSDSPYEHRAVAFKSARDGHWYILDPYRANKSQKPIPFAEYKGKIEFAVPLTADSAPAVAYAPGNMPPSAALAPFFQEAIAETESRGYPEKSEKDNSGPGLRFHLVNFHAAVAPSVRPLLDQDGVPLPPTKFLEKENTADKLFKDRLPQDYASYKKELERLHIDPRAIAYCALGKYQFIPAFHFEKMGWNYKDPETVYQYLKDPSRQDQLMAKATEITGKRYHWNYAAMMAAHYGGDRAAQEVMSHPNSQQLEKTQELGYPSISNYIRETMGRMANAKEQAAKKIA